MFKSIVFILTLICLSFSVKLIAPYEKEIGNGDLIDLGTIGPGQTVSLQLDPSVTSGGIYGSGGIYDFALVSSVPSGWKSTDSKLYQKPMQITITADPFAKEGEYISTIVIVDENNGEKLGNITFKAKIKITYDVLDVEISPKTYKNIGPGQPARFEVSITNKGSTSDVFEISAIGPKSWSYKQQIFVPSKSTRKIYYEVAAQEEETYKTTLKIVSLASEKIFEEQEVSIQVRSDLIGDYLAVNRGTIIFPIFETPIYALAGLVANVFRLVGA